MKNKMLMMLVVAIWFMGLSPRTMADTSSCEGNKSPQEVFSMAENAVVEENWRLLYNCLTPEYRIRAIEEVIYGLLIALSIKNNEEGIIPEFLKKHQFRIDKNGVVINIEEDLKNIKDLFPLFEDIYKTAIRITGKKSGEIGATIDKSKLFDIVIDGDQAIGVKNKAQNDKAKQREVHFKKIFKSWYIDNEIQN